MDMRNYKMTMRRNTNMAAHDNTSMGAKQIDSANMPLTHICMGSIVWLDAAKCLVVKITRTPGAGQSDLSYVDLDDMHLYAGDVKTISLDNTATIPLLANVDVGELVTAAHNLGDRGFYTLAALLCDNIGSLNPDPQWALRWQGKADEYLVQEKLQKELT